MFQRFVIVTVLAFIGAVSAYGQLALMTFLNNSSSAQVRSVDLYVSQAGATSKVGGIGYQRANNLNSVAIFGDLEVTLSVAPAGSIGVSEAFASHTFTPVPDAGYVAVLMGLVSATGTLPNPDGVSTTAKLLVFEVASENADPTKTGLFVVQGATDLEKSDVWVRGGTKAVTSNLVYGGRSTVEFVADRKTAIVDFTVPGDKAKPIASFSVDFLGLGSEVVIGVLSGFKTPGDNNSTDTLAFLSLLDDGRVVVSPLIAGSQTARVQIVHNAADPQLGTVDLWVNGVKAQDNISFRRASAYIPLPANAPIVFGIAPATSTQYRDTLLTITLDPLRPGRVYTLVASGVLDPTKFSANPSAKSTKLTIMAYDGALEASDIDGKSAVRTGHFVTDGGVLVLANSSWTSLSAGLQYQDMAGTYVGLEPAMDTIWVLDTAGKRVKGFVADLRGTGKSVLVLASGFMHPDSNSSGAPFKLILVESNGTVNSSLIEVLPSGTSVQDGLIPGSTWTVGPNPSSDHVIVRIPAGNSANWSDGAGTMSVFSSDGALVSAVPLVSDGGYVTVSLSLGLLPSGAYRLRATTASGALIGVSGITVRR